MRFTAVPKMYERTISKSTQKELEHEYYVQFGYQNAVDAFLYQSRDPNVLWNERDVHVTI